MNDDNIILINNFNIENRLKFKNINFWILLCGMVYTISIYGTATIIGSIIQKNDKDVFITMYWMILFRFLGELMMIFSMLLYKKYKKEEIILHKIEKTTICTSLLPLLSLTGWFGYFNLITYGEISIVKPFINLYIIIPIIISTIIKKYKFTLLKTVGSLFGIGAGCMFGFLSEKHDSSMDWQYQLTWFLIVFVVWSCVDTISAIVCSNTLNIFSLVFYHSIGYITACTIIGAIIISKSLKFNFDIDWILLFGMNIIQPTGWIMYVFLCKKNASFVTSFFSLNYIIPVCYGLLFMNEEINVFKIIALILSVFSILLLSLSIRSKNEK